VSATVTIPESTRQRLANPAGPGSRHAEIVRNVAALIAAGLNGDAVFHQIRPSYAIDVSDAEIRAVIQWAEKRFSASLPSRFTRNNRSTTTDGDRPWSTVNRAKEPPETAIVQYLNGFSCEEADLWEASPIRLPDLWQSDGEALLAALYSPTEPINIVSDFAVHGEKASPKGYGKTLKRDDWLTAFKRNGPPVSESGIWIRPNPTDGKGIADENVTVYRFALLEFDAIPFSLQLSFLARLSVPIAAVITSGGKSLHAWVSVCTGTAAEYRTVVSELFNRLAPFGIDLANRNPSRLSRLPGGFRNIGGGSDNRQRLLYLNPFPKTSKIIP
jgi:hypothetical protein